MKIPRPGSLESVLPLSLFAELGREGIMTTLLNFLLSLKTLSLLLLLFSSLFTSPQNTPSLTEPSVKKSHRGESVVIKVEVIVVACCEGQEKTPENQSELLVDDDHDKKGDQVDQERG